MRGKWVLIKEENNNSKGLQPSFRTILRGIFYHRKMMFLAREEWIHVYVWLSPFVIHLKLSQHCLLINYTPI